MPYVQTRLGRLFYEERGEARRPGDPAIVLLHGLLFDGGMWRGQVEPLAALGRVIVIDGPGHGRSERAPRFMLEEHADALFDAAGELGIRRAVIVGLSWGGMVAMRFAVQHAERVAGLALLDTNAEGDTLANRVRARVLIAMHRRVGGSFSLFRKEVGPKMFARRTIAERPELVLSAYQRAMGFDREGLCRAAIAVLVHRRNVLRELWRVRAPTLVLCGAEDIATPPKNSESIAAAIPHAKLVLLDGVGHMSALEAPERVNAELVPFVRSIVAG